ncbi:DNA polymerase III subunit delta [Melioribacteraceae bacterium 4301-Me]|uniref:DNA polymerase III subunit delta n=1 Tax=Pyranulibacter aquaticus TaxID=3163344 RepID=UPI0035977C77
MSKPKIQSVNELPNCLTKKKLQPVFFFFGEDFYSIDNAVKMVLEAVQPLIASEFDKEIISIEKGGKSLSEILDNAYTFPFGGKKRLIIIKNFEKTTDKKLLINYLKQPPEFTILVIAYYDKITDVSKEPFNTLNKFNFIFEAKKPDEDDLSIWIAEKAKENKITISNENAKMLIDIVGNDKFLIEMQLKKIYNFLNEGDEITLEIIQNLASYTKEFSIFDLQDALGKGDKLKALDIAYNLLDNGNEITYILAMLTKFIATVAQSTEMISQNVNDNEASKKIGVSWAYYVNCKKAKYFLSDKHLLNASMALLEADAMVKTMSVDVKTIISMLISNMIKE